MASTQSTGSGSDGRRRGWKTKRTLVCCVVAVALAVLLLAVPVTLRWWRDDPLLGGNRINLAYLPEDTKLVHYIRLADAVATPERKKWLLDEKHCRSQIEYLQDITGLRAEDVESILLAYRDKDAIKVYLDGPRALFNTDVDWLCVARTNKAYSEKTIRDLVGAHDEETQAGKTLYPFGSHYLLYLPDAKTILFGTAAEVRTAVERRGKEYRLEAFDLLDTDEFFSYAIDLDVTGVETITTFKLARAAGAIACGYSARYEADRDIYRERVDLGSVASTKRKAYFGDKVLHGRAWSEGSVFVLENAGWRNSVADLASRDLLRFLSAPGTAFDPAYFAIRVADGSAPGDRQWELTRLGIPGEIFVHERRREEVLQTLIPLSKGSDIGLRHSAIPALAVVGGEDMLPHLFDCLARQEDRETVLSALRILGERVEAGLIEGLESSDANVRDVSRGMLAEFASEETLAGLSSRDAAARPHIDRAYLPADTKAIHYVRVADALPHFPYDDPSSAFNHALMNQAEERTGIGLAEIESVTIAYPERSAKALGPKNFWTMITPDEPVDFVAVVRLSKTFDESTLLQFLDNPTPASLSGMKYFPVRSSHAVFFPDPRTIVAGTLEEVKAVIAEDGSQPLELLDAIDPDDHATIIFADRPHHSSLTVRGFGKPDIESYAVAMRYRDGKLESRERLEFTTYKAAWMEASPYWQYSDPNVEYTIDGKIAVYWHKLAGSTTAYHPTFRLLRWVAVGR